MEQMRQMRAQLEAEHIAHGRRLAAQKRQQAHTKNLNVMAMEMGKKAASATVKAQGQAVQAQLWQQRSEWAGYGKALAQHHGLRAQSARIHESKEEYSQYARAVAEQGRQMAAYSKAGRKGEAEAERQTNWAKAERVRRDEGRSRHVAPGSARGRRRGGTAGMSRGQLAKRAVHEQNIDRATQLGEEARFLREERERVEEEARARNAALKLVALNAHKEAALAKREAQQRKKERADHERQRLGADMDFARRLAEAEDRKKRQLHDRVNKTRGLATARGGSDRRLMGS